MTPDTASLEAKIGLLTGHVPETALFDVAARQLEAVEAVLAAAEDGDWEELRAASLHCLGLGDAALDHLHALADSRSDRRQLASARRRELAEQLLAGASGGDEDPLFQRLSDLLGEDPEAVAASFALLEQGVTEGVPLLEALDPERPVPFDLRPKLLALANLCRVRGLMGLAQAEFQDRYAGAPGAAPPLPPKARATALRADRERFEAGLRSRQEGLRALLASGAEPEEVRDHAAAFGSWVRRSIVRFCRSQAEGLRAAEALLESGAGGAAEELGGELVEAGFATREAIASYAASGRVTVELQEPDLRDDVSAVLRADQDDFAFSLEDGKNTPLAHLPDTDDGKLVDVEGFVKEIRVTRLGGQLLVSEIVLEDPSSGASASAAATFINARNAGIASGSYCRVTGTSREESNLLGDRPGIEVERLDLKDASERSWRLAFLRLADPWFHIWRNSLGIRWALGSHDPEGGLASDRSGAAEIVFLPLLRPDDLT